MIFLRVLFAIAVVISTLFGSLFIATIMVRGNDNEHRSVSKSIALLITSILVSVFVTLWCVEKGII